MAERDTVEWRIKQAIALRKPRKKPTPKLAVNPLWYQRPPVTINSHLRQAILDVFPFNMDKKTADLILRTIFNTIADEVRRGGSVTIPGFGKFYKRVVRERVSSRTINGEGGRLINIGRYISPQRYRLAWAASRSIRRMLSVEGEVDGNSGTN